MANAFLKESVLQKLFPAFPTGWPGFGLLLLRVLVAFLIVTQTTVFSGWLTAAVVLTSGGCLLLGFMTPISAVVTGLLSLILTFSGVSAIEIIALTTAIALLGPGAFSIDARMFGRREVLIPDRANPAPAATDRSDR